MKTNHESRLKKLEGKLPAEPVTVTIIRYGSLPSPEEMERARSASRGVDLRFELYKMPEQTAGAEDGRALA